jgi:phosphoenolpyruvate carboxykinase (GTP)
VARVESKTVISTERREQVVPNGKNPQPGAMPNWMDPQQLNSEIMKRFPNTMKG